MDHVRIDEGIKKGPRKPKKPKITRAPRADPGTAIPPDLDPKHVLDLYLQHPTTSGIAQQLGVRRSTLTLWLRERCPTDWKNVQIARALIRKEDGDAGIEGADDALSLARAREMLRSGQWDLERLDSANYGQKQELSVDVNYHVIIESALVNSAASLAESIRGEVTVAQTPNAALLQLDPEVSRGTDDK